MVQDAPLRANYVLIPAQLPDDLPVTSVEAEDLPADWRTLGARSVLQEIGRIWLDEGRTAVMSVPSVVVPAERNYLLNPAHPDFFAHQGRHAGIARGRHALAQESGIGRSADAAHDRQIGPYGSDVRTLLPPQFPLLHQHSEHWGLST